MASLESTLANTLSYSAQFNFPLTSKEVWFWQIQSRYSKSQISLNLSRLYKSKNNFYYLVGSHISSRLNNEISSQVKWGIAKKTAQRLKHIPFITAIFVTGALSMNNSPKDDDIDLMIVSYPHTLWITRLLVLFMLGDNRRPASIPEHSSWRVSNKICDNLYLTNSSLLVKTQNLYTAHEVLQAQCLFDRAGVANMFLLTNSWVKNYLPQAYSQLIKQPSSRFISKKIQINKYSSLKFVNEILYKLQYLYMRKKITNEKISLEQAFFHPRIQKITNL